MHRRGDVERAQHPVDAAEPEQPAERLPRHDAHGVGARVSGDRKALRHAAPERADVRGRPHEERAEGDPDEQRADLQNLRVAQQPAPVDVRQTR